MALVEADHGSAIRMVEFDLSGRSCLKFKRKFFFLFGMVENSKLFPYCACVRGGGGQYCDGGEQSRDRRDPPIPLTRENPTGIQSN